APLQIEQILLGPDVDVMVVCTTTFAAEVVSTRASSAHHGSRKTVECRKSIGTGSNGADARAFVSLTILPAVSVSPRLPAPIFSPISSTDSHGISGRNSLWRPQGQFGS